MDGNTWVIGDSLLVKPGISEKATGKNIGGWQGRLVALSEHEDTVTIQWDSLTLKSIPLAYIMRCEEWGVSWSMIRLAVQDLVLTTARDHEEDVTTAIAAIEMSYSWLSLGEQGKRIQQIVNRVETHDQLACFKIWHAYLQERLTFPFVATVIEAQRGPIPQHAEVMVTGIILRDDTVGTIVRIRLKRRVYHLPLYELRAPSAATEIQQLISDYATWFAYHPRIYSQNPL